MDAVIVNHLRKVYQDKTAVDDVSFAVKKGELFGLIGPDGAGKTSIFRMLTTLLLPDAGSATVDGYDVVKDYKAIRNLAGYMPGKFSLYQDLTVEENINFFATVFKTTVAKNYDLIKDIYIQIAPFKKRRAGKLSGGMKQKLALCCALIHRPSVLFLDEPTTGVDPVSRKEFWEMLRKLKEQEITIIVSTPYMDEADLCDRIALIQDGKILSIDTPNAVVAAFPDKLYAVKADQMHRLLKALQASPLVKDSYAFGEYAHVTFEGDLEQELAKQGLTGIELQTTPVTIEDCFIKLLKEKQ
ncbi:ABC transporter ATP-binding protein [Chitinophaga silvisoli]|uniref:ABC transporter ATP-binding protein n=1 Tax=Chitinophaga silvisoli TaxID=2291814 RepID=A0A3E1NTX3_9BACT|nr:ABC transporter ATP-binding protein [Chitinophaga silvisoli]RFM31389.1 ABC transporter ATP-binding protein [Chitinophaga silvisoli]